MQAKVFLKAKRERSVGHRHPWIFSGAIDRVTGAPPLGGNVEVVDAHGARLGWGSWSPASAIRVRMLAYGARAREPDAAYVAGLVKAAVARRPEAFAPHAGVRLVHGESDFLPGVTVDCYDGWCVVQLASAGAEYWKDAIVEALAACGAKGVYNRSDVDARTREGLRDDAGARDAQETADAREGEASKPRAAEVGLLAGAEPPELIEIHENGIRYYVDVRTGHKTGFYLDQREARRLVGELARGREVLNCFAYTGGFGLACAAGGAKSVVNLDLSRPALELAEKNFALTFAAAPVPAASETARAAAAETAGDAVRAVYGETAVTFECADVFKRLRLYRDQGRTFDLIVLDPPKFADTKGQLIKAARGYKDINLLAMKMLRPGGILATFSCSGAMDAPFFDTVCREAAWDAHATFQVIARTRQAADHPVALDFPEGFYLKGLVMRRSF